MPEVVINYWAVVVAALAAMIIGSLWYAPFVFGKTWQKLVGLSDKQLKEADKVTPMVAMVVLAIVQAFVLVHLIAYAKYFYPTATDMSVGFLVAVWAWIGLVLPALGGSYFFAQRRKKLLILDSVNILITLVVVSSILTVWN